MFRASPEGRELARAQRRANSQRQHLRRVACLQRGPGKRSRRFNLYLERSDGTITLEIAEQLYAAPRCHYCRRELEPGNRTIDHVVPLELGGVHGVANVVPCCAYCNDSKGRKLLDEWVGPWVVHVSDPWPPPVWLELAQGGRRP